jgi:ligand-binding sensor domain-containing protein
VTSIIQTKDTSVYVGGGLLDRGGAVKLEKEKDIWVITQTISSKEGLAGAKVRSLFEDTSGKLWAGSEYDGLAIFDGKKSLQLKKSNGLSDDEVKAIIEDSHGFIWIGTKSGLTRIDKAKADIKQ